MKYIMGCLVFLLLSGCGTMAAVVGEGDPCSSVRPFGKSIFPRYIYQGVQLDLRWTFGSIAEVQPVYALMGIVDLPFTLAFDTLLLPRSILYEFTVDERCEHNKSKTKSISQLTVSRKSIGRIGIFDAAFTP